TRGPRDRPARRSAGAACAAAPPPRAARPRPEAWPADLVLRSCGHTARAARGPDDGATPGTTGDAPGTIGDDGRVPTLTDLVRDHSDLTEDDLEWLHALVSDWQRLADLSFADLLLWIPLRSAAALPAEPGPRGRARGGVAPPRRPAVRGPPALDPAAVRGRAARRAGTAGPRPPRRDRPRRGGARLGRDSADASDDRPHRRPGGPRRQGGPHGAARPDRRGVAGAAHRPGGRPGMG